MTVGPAPPSWLVEVPLAHRGLHGPGVPENSLAAFAAARDAGVGVELDVWPSRDGVPVVHHDRTLLRLTGDRRAVTSLTAADLAGLRLADGDDHVPTLVEVLDVLGDTPAMVELKRGPRAGGIEQSVRDVLAGHRGPACIASFDPRAVAWFARHAPAVVRVQTAGPLTDVPLPPPVRWALRTLRLNGVGRPHAVSYDLAGLDHPMVQRHRRDGGTVLAWTVRTPADLARARTLADNVIFESPLTPTELLTDGPGL